MQSIKNIYEKIYDFENLHKAWEEARKGKRYRDDVLIFNRNYEEQLINIQNHLIYETYEVGKYHTFYVYEPKKRLIMSLPFNPDYYSNCLVLLESQGRKHYQNQKGIPGGNKGYFC
jgi:hypothetical protein